MILYKKFIICEKNKLDTSKIMLLVLIAIIPSFILQICFFGYGILLQATLAIVTALFSEIIVFILRGISILKILQDNSSFITAMLIGINLPPLSPWWIVSIGTCFAIIIAKHIYGGLGQNLFNPAMVGYAALLISFPMHMTNNSLIKTSDYNKINLLDTINIIFSNRSLQKDFEYQKNIINYTNKIKLINKYSILVALYKKIFTKKHIRFLMQCKWQLINLCYLIAGLLLVWKDIINYIIPFSILLSLFFLYTVKWFFLPIAINCPISYLFSGANMLCAFFIATDPVTSATTNYGKLIYGILIGILLFFIQKNTYYFNEVVFSILIANMFVPLIDYYTIKRN
ncbi:MAG: RnfABCDGE type electron transport complex subunit D [Pantoea sp. Brub]|nr:RnfABCDGE type electron transport complex subunit D [Pantoea sp. Brub]